MNHPMQIFSGIQQSMKRKTAKALMLMLSSIMIFGGVMANAASITNADKILLKAIVLNMGTDGATVLDAQYDKYFKQGNSATGVSAVIAAGNFFINGYAIPATETEYARKYPNGYLVNQVPWLYYDSSKTIWKGGYKGEKAAASYAAATLAVATGIVAGLEVRLYDTDHDGYADLIEADYKEGVQVGQITKNSDGTYSVYRGDIDTAHKTTFEGRAFDGAHFTSTSGERIAAKNFDASIAANDVALFWYGPHGWVMQRAREVNGIFVDGSDHQSYNIDGTAYADAMRFSRDNIFISNRPGEYANAQKYFGLNNSHEKLKSSLWLVPTTVLKAQGAPIGITSNSSAKAFLEKAISTARKTLASVAVSADGKDIPTTGKWVTQGAYAQLNDAIARADEVLTSAASSPALLDYQIYLLYLTLNGSDSDIGARFGGFHYVGFVRGISSGTMK